MNEISAIAHLIELSVAPVFLIAGIGAIMNVLTSRLARIVDRARALEADLEKYSQEEPKARLALDELSVLDRRMAAAHWAINLCTTSVLFVCIAVVLLFLSEFLEFSFARPVALLFAATMMLLIVGLILFLIEMSIATRHVRVRRDLIRRE